MRSRERGVLSCTPAETLESIIPRLSKVTGLPVLNEQGKVVGVISRKVNGPGLSREAGWLCALSQGFAEPGCHGH